MHRSLRAAGAAVVLGALALTASDTVLAQDVTAHDEGPPGVDFAAFFGAVPQMKALAEETLEQSRQIADLMDRLAATEGDPGKNRVERGALRDLLVKYRDNKAALVRLTDAALNTPAPKESDLDVMRKLRETELVGIHWDRAKFINCLRDIAGAVGVRITMHPDVLKNNTVEASMPRAAADGLLAQLCALCDSEYVVYNGEVIVVKKYKRNDKRLQAFLDKHPDWKFWRKKAAVEVEDDL